MEFFAPNWVRSEEVCLSVCRKQRRDYSDTVVGHGIAQPWAPAIFISGHHVVLCCAGDFFPSSSDVVFYMGLSKDWSASKTTPLDLPHLPPKSSQPSALGLYTHLRRHHSNLNRAKRQDVLSGKGATTEPPTFLRRGEEDARDLPIPVRVHPAVCLY